MFLFAVSGTDFVHSPAMSQLMQFACGFLLDRQDSYFRDDSDNLKMFGMFCRLYGSICKLNYNNTMQFLFLSKIVIVNPTMKSYYCSCFFLLGREDAASESHEPQVRAGQHDGGHGGVHSPPGGTGQYLKH